MKSNKDLEGLGDSFYDKKSELDMKPVRQSSKSRTVGFSDNMGNKGTPGSAARTQKIGSAKKGDGPISKFSADQTDRIYTLEKENTTLKSKENLLQTEINKMKVKLRRIEELLRKKSKQQDVGE